MPFPPEVEAARARVFQLIGRNVLRFQRIELVLKSLVAGSQISITAGEVPTAHERRIQATNKKSMGLVAGQLFEEVLSNQPPADDDVPVSREEAKAGNKAHIGFSWKIHIPMEEHLHWKTRLQKLIEERNELIHTSLLRLNLETLEGCQQGLASLEEQATCVLAEIERLKPLHEGAVESKRALLELLSDHGLTA